MAEQGLKLALDIGTRKVLGLIFEPTDSGIQVRAYARREHRGRAMRDGQIHDVPAVAAVVKEVLTELYEKTGRTLSSAYVAAAGRSLITARGRASIESQQQANPFTNFSSDLVRQLEWEAVAGAQATVAGDVREGAGYYCVGYSVTRCWLDGEPISRLTGHVGEKAELEVLATFLPRGVVDALEAVLAHVGLQLAGLTLEPIAALDAVVPPTTRHLNLVLIDIGAGTSDIAVTSNGTVHGYAMAPIAGDAVTEFLAKSLLLDFHVAERAKRQASSGKPARVKDIFGKVKKVSQEDLLQITRPLIQDLASRISQAVNQVFDGDLHGALLVGGGSQTPGLREELARALDLPLENVAVRPREVVPGVQGGRGLRGPDAITPLGIALMASRSGGLPLVRVQVGDRWVRLFQPGRCTVGEALRAAGVPRAAVVGRPGPGITVTVNGQVRIFPGGRGEPGVVYMDGQAVTLDTECKDLSHITWDPAIDGHPASPSVKELLVPEYYLPLQLNGEDIEIPPFVYINGRPAGLDDRLSDRDQVDIRPCSVVADLLQHLNLPHQPNGAVEITYNGVTKTVPLGNQVAVDGSPATLDTPLKPGCRVDWLPEKITIRQMVEIAGFSIPTGVPVTVNGAEITVSPPVICRCNGVEVGLEHAVTAGDVVEVMAPKEWRPMLNEVLAHVKNDLARPDGRLILTIDGRPATFVTTLYPGAAVNVTWEGNGHAAGNSKNSK